MDENKYMDELRTQTTCALEELDPNGLDAHAPGAKLDKGKLRPALVLGGFANALRQVSEVGTFGATKYTPNGWKSVDNGIERYEEAMMRHYLDEKTEGRHDEQTGLLHAAHLAWNALARLELMLTKSEHEGNVIKGTSGTTYTDMVVPVPDELRSRP